VISNRSRSAGIFRALAKAARANGEYTRAVELRDCATMLSGVTKLEDHQGKMATGGWNRGDYQAQIKLLDVELSAGRG
jgi:hypothetical protein